LVVAVGVRIVDAAGFRERLSRDFIASVFLPEEAGYADSRARRHESFAARFAAKEAVIDALGDRGIGLNRVEVFRNDDSGEVGVRLYGEAAERAALMGVDRVSLSMSHAGGAALALVVLTGSGTRPVPQPGEKG